jgi:hypothetical protein
VENENLERPAISGGGRCRRGRCEQASALDDGTGREGLLNGMATVTQLNGAVSSVFTG